MQFKNLIVTVREGVAELTIHRPEQLNALNRETLQELTAALENLATDTAVRVVIVTGAGEKAFVAGADIKEMVDLEPLDAAAFAQQGQKILALIANMRQPVIAAVNGYALGGGFEMALACDFIYAAQSAKFGFPETTLGIMPGFGGTQKLSRLVGSNIAKELIFTGRMVDSARAADLGIVGSVFPDDKLLEMTRKTAQKIAANGGVGVAMAKEVISKGLDMSLNEALAFEGRVFGLLFATRDQKEGMQAFIEKRKAEFTNK